VTGDSTEATRLLAESPALATARFEVGASRHVEKSYYLEEIQRHIYAGDTALHIAAAAYWTDLARELLVRGANLHAKNRRGAEPLHAAAGGIPGSPSWNPPAQAATIACLIESGADPNAVDQSGVAPLHVAVRTRCAAAVGALLAAGADVQRKNRNGSTPIFLATHSTGRGGTGSAEAKAEQAEIVQLLQQYGATPP
jgi:ankyrin repeat protein